jgi:D-beta-D-heptose 7-phosphate kinase/D-beta-D-heptose 1-phosphate adenosyltransferase
MQALDQFLYDDELRKIKIAVVGDIVLDEYFFVDASRISPEFSIPVMRSDTQYPQKVAPGGAANTAVQFKHFNVDVSLFGIIDEYANKILSEFGIETDTCLLTSDRFHTPLKRRFYQGQFPLCRWDVEEKLCGLNEEELQEKQLSLFLKYEQSTPDVVIFSDYNKCLFVNDDTFRNKWFKEDVISIVDPKNGPCQLWRGCTVFKPNAKEAKEMSGYDDWKDQCDFFEKHVQCPAVIITHGGKGVAGKVNGRYFEYWVEEKDAVCPIGAGDSYVAFLAMALGRMIDIVEAVKIAFEAGAVYVQKKHNTPVQKHELIARFDPIKAKFVKPEYLNKRDYKLVMTNGVFDLGLTRGHVECLNYAKSLGDKLVVAVNDDDSVRRLKGDARPIVPLEERMAVLAGLSAVDFVVSFKEDTPLEIIHKLNPDLIVKSGYKLEDVVGHGIVPVIIAPFVECISTTEKIRQTTI